jgi:hypothetical protein
MKQPKQKVIFLTGATGHVGRILELAEDFFRRRRPEFKLPKLRFVSRKWLSVARIVAPFLSRPKRRAVEKLRWFIPYLRVSRLFDVSSARAVLKDEAVAAPAFEAYYQSLLEYCLRTNWGDAARTAPGRRLATPAPQGA